MNSLSKFYKNQISTNQKRLAKVKKQLLASSMLRSVVFLLAVTVIYVVFGNMNAVLAVIFVALVIFFFLVSRHSDLQYKRDLYLTLININDIELEVLDRNFHQLANGSEFTDPKHHYSQDIDLFGKGSFYQYCNRTTLKNGSETLARLLAENSIEGISQKQEAVSELAQMPEWRQEFSAIATLVKTETPYPSIIKWLSTYMAFLPKAMQFLPNIFSLLSIAAIGMYLFGLVPGSVIVFWIFIGLGITGIYLKHINKLAANTSKVQSTFQQYQKLILEVEEIHFKSKLLKDKKDIISKGKRKASVVLKEFSGILNALDQRNNMIFGFLGNAFLLWDLRQCYKLEQWISEHGAEVEAWFNTIAFFDVYNSLGNFAFNHPNYSYPTLTDKEIVLKASAAAHPLLDPKKRIANDIHVNKKQFFIVTGANMAGKSTFLRTVSLQIVMANVGLPVCATSVEYNPIKLITSMRTTDSLTDDESYFFSELKRLKFIVDQIEDDRYFIILDEILKGTNSTDKALGSRKFVERLVESKSTGIIATHDLSLCDVAKDMSKVENHYFDAEIINDELHFDYKFKKGICKNMNASFLLKKMEIVN